MKIIIAPDSFKGSLSSMEAANSIERGIKKVNEDIEVVKVPMADGGEGTVEALIHCTEGSLEYIKVKDPLYREVNSYYGILGDGATAIIEMAAASGLPLLKEEERNPLLTTTYGTGQLILHALDKGCRNFIIGIGGSATNDGGAGMLTALGAKLLDKSGSEIRLGGAALSDLHKINLESFDKRIYESNFIIACDVDNPLCGERGASAVFAPQKGADKAMVQTLDNNLYHYAQVVKETINKDVVDIPGAGAAGGLGAAFFGFFNGKMERGIDVIIKLSNLEEKIIKADLVITGEGAMDFQTGFGKTPFGIAKLCEKHSVPVIGICGSLGEGYESLYSCGFSSIFSIIDKPMTLCEAIENTETLLEGTAERIMRLINTFNS